MDLMTRVRLDLLSAESQPILRELFRKYLDSRLEVYHKFGDLEAVTIDLAKCSKLQMASGPRLWRPVGCRVLMTTRPSCFFRR
jgi:hypothetical protein